MYAFQEQFYYVLTKLRANSNSRAASRPDVRVTEITNALSISKPTKKEPEVIDLQEFARSDKAAASVQSINKIKEIADFINFRFWRLHLRISTDFIIW